MVRCSLPDAGAKSNPANKLCLVVTGDREKNIPSLGGTEAQFNAA